jgi:DnaA family protein
MVAQIPMNFAPADNIAFESFFPGGNEVVVQALREICDGNGPVCLYLWGADGSGKTHLLQAACRQVSEDGAKSLYLPLDRAGQFTVEVLEGLESMQLVCLDDIQSIARRGNWQEAVFHLFNRIHDSSGHLVIAGSAAPAHQGFTLPDLASRLGSGPVFHLQVLDDEGKQQALMQRARIRGINLSNEVTGYLMKHYPRDMQFLFDFLDTLDTASLIDQRRITVPYIKELLRDQEAAD